MSFTTDATPNASIPPSEMPDATNPNPQKKDSTLRTVLIVLAVIFCVQFVLPIIFIIIFIFALGPNLEEIINDFTDEFSYETDGSYGGYGGTWRIADTEQCLVLGSDNEFTWRQVCDDEEDNYISGNYTVKYGSEAVDDLSLSETEIADLIKIDDDYMTINRLYSFHLFVRSEVLSGEENTTTGVEHQLIFYNQGTAATLYSMDDEALYELEYYIPATTYDYGDDDDSDLPIDIRPESDGGANRT